MEALTSEKPNRRFLLRIIKNYQKLEQGNISGVRHVSVKLCSMFSVKESVNSAVKLHLCQVRQSKQADFEQEKFRRVNFRKTSGNLLPR